MKASYNLDKDLTDLAASVLRDNGFHTEEIAEETVKLVLAENPYFLVAIVATSTISQLLTAESFAEGFMSKRISESEVGPKRWDAYLLLLTQERSPETQEITRGLFEINYDTSRLRRIAHAGVPATRTAVTAVLSPFMPPLLISDDSISTDPSDLLIGELLSRGISSALAQRAIDAFEKGEPLVNVL